MEKITVDSGQSFDFGKTSAEYAKYRDIYPKELYDRLLSYGVGKSGTRWLDLGTGTGVIPRHLAQYGADIYATDISAEQIAQAEKLSKEYNNIHYSVCPSEELCFHDNYFDVITACQCFWYFDPEVIVPKIRKLLKPGGIFLKVYMEWLEDGPIAMKSTAIVRKLNHNWESGSPAIADLNTHYFDSPQTDSFTVDLPFTRESWHGRMTACRGTLASMSAETFAEFEKRHIEMLEEFPEKFTVRHKIYITGYTINK